MSQPLGAGQVATADQLMRRMLNAAARLEAACDADAAELVRIRDQRMREMVEAEKTARASAESDIDGAVGLGAGTSLGSELRNELAKLPSLQIKHLDAGPAPDTFESAIHEWRSLAPAARSQVGAFKKSFGAWESKVLKRARTRPQVSDDLWQMLDRLDVIHRSIRPFQQATVANRIREVSGAFDVLIQAETEKQNASQLAQAVDVRSAVAEVEVTLGLAGASWADPRWDAPVPVERLDHLVRLGQLEVGLPDHLRIPSIPALVSFPFASGIAIDADVTARESALGLVRSLILRLLAAVPPGGIQIKVVDPVSLGRSVAEFRHLSEYDSRLMDEKTWTSERDIERQLDDLSAHLEVVISKYLRGQFESIDDYNEHAGEVAQPYRLLVVFDYPSGFSDRASKQLLSLVENGPQCGVYTVLHYDTSASSTEVRSEVPTERLVHAMQKVTLGARQARPYVDGRATLELVEPVGLVQLGLLPDEAPPIVFDQEGNAETGPAKLLARIGTYVRQTHANPPAVTLESLLPILSRARNGTLPDLIPGAPVLTADPETWWGATTSASAMAVLGRSGAQGVTSMLFSSTEVAGGAIMVGLPRSGKTTALHSMILSMSMLYSPDELELYLIDAKHGVEFEIYRELPHARMVSVHSDREFSLAVLRSIQTKVRERAALFKSSSAGLANITEYRVATGEKLPRIVVVMDEFHELFEEPDSIGFEAFAAFSDIVRMGPFAGVHMVVSSQTLSAMPAMDRQTLLLLPERVTFQCNEDDAEVVMGPTNKAPRTLSKKGQGVFNPARGEESRNELFQGLFVPSAPRGQLLASLRSKADSAGWARRPRVFDGEALVHRPPFEQLLTGTGSRFTVPVGEPFTLSEAEYLVMPRARGGNLLLVGDRDDEESTCYELRGVLHSVLLAARVQDAGITVVDLVGDEQVSGGDSLMDVAYATGARYARSRSFEAVIREYAGLVAQRNSNEEFKGRTEVLVISGLQRALSLAPFDPYDYSEDEEPGLAKLLASVILGGPDVGVHVVVSADRAHAVNARLGSAILGDFSQRAAGSTADDRDLRLVAGDYGDVSPLAPGQLLVIDSMKGTSKRVRGYRLVNTTAHHSQERDAHVQ